MIRATFTAAATALFAAATFFVHASDATARDLTVATWGGIYTKH